MTQRNIEIVVGRLLTDEEFLDRFLTNPRDLLQELLELGTHLTRVEIDALVSTDSQLWKLASELIDARIQKVSLKG